MNTLPYVYAEVVDITSGWNPAVVYRTPHSLNAHRPKESFECKEIYEQSQLPTLAFMKETLGYYSAQNPSATYVLYVETSDGLCAVSNRVIAGCEYVEEGGKLVDTERLWVQFPLFFRGSLHDEKPQDHGDYRLGEVFKARRSHRKFARPNADVTCFVDC